MRKLALGRMLGLLLTVFALVVTVAFLKFAWDFDTLFQAWLTARPMETKLDLSQPGTVTIPFQQTCSTSHGEGIYLDCDVRNEQGAVPNGLFSEFSGSVVIHDLSGKEIVNRRLTVSDADSVSGELLLVDLPTFQTGDYAATIRVDSGVPSLAGHPQFIYAKYQLCGLEKMPVAICGFISFCAGCVTLLIGGFAVPAFCRKGIWKHIVVEQAPSVESAETAVESTGEEPPRELFF